MENSSEQIKNTYLLRFIVRGQASPDDLQGYNKSVSSKVNELDGKLEASVCSESPRPLAYPISKEGQGYFCESVFQLDPEKLGQIYGIVRQDKNILRYVIEKKPPQTRPALRPSEARKAEWKKRTEEMPAKPTDVPKQESPEQEKRGKVSAEELDRKLDEIIKNI